MYTMNCETSQFTVVKINYTSRSTIGTLGPLLVVKGPWNTFMVTERWNTREGLFRHPCLHGRDQTMISDSWKYSSDTLSMEYAPYDCDLLSTNIDISKIFWNWEFDFFGIKPEDYRLTATISEANLDSVFCTCNEFCHDYWTPFSQRGVHGSSTLRVTRAVEFHPLKLSFWYTISLDWRLYSKNHYYYYYSKIIILGSFSRVIHN